MGVGAPAPALPLTSCGKPPLTTSSTSRPTHVTLHPFILPESHSPSSPAHIHSPDLTQSSRGLGFPSSTQPGARSRPPVPAELSAQGQARSPKQEPRGPALGGWVRGSCVSGGAGVLPSLRPGKGGSLRAALVAMAARRLQRLPEPPSLPCSQSSTSSPFHLTAQIN